MGAPCGFVRVHLLTLLVTTVLIAGLLSAHFHSHTESDWYCHLFPSFAGPALNGTHIKEISYGWPECLLRKSVRTEHVPLFTSLLSDSENAELSKMNLELQSGCTIVCAGIPETTFVNQYPTLHRSLTGKGQSTSTTEWNRGALFNAAAASLVLIFLAIFVCEIFIRYSDRPQGKPLQPV
jgi:hypothetical protein